MSVIMEQQDRRDEQGHGETLLVPVEARGDEGPELVQNPRHRQEGRDEERQLERRRERRHHARRDEVSPRRQLLLQRLGDVREDVVRVHHARHEAQGDTHECLDEPIAQFQQVRDQRAFGELFGFLSHQLP
jgi:hypothetical protein